MSRDADLGVLGLDRAGRERLEGALDGGGIGSVMQAIDMARISSIGAGLLTVNGVRLGAAPGTFALTRLWSSDPVSYPVGGTKHKAPARWTEVLLVRGEDFIGEGEAAIAEAFDDHARIAALGLLAVINLPIAAAGRVVATFNLLGQRPGWNATDIARARCLAALATPSILAAAAQGAG